MMMTQSIHRYWGSTRGSAHLEDAPNYNKYDQVARDSSVKKEDQGGLGQDVQMKDGDSFGKRDSARSKVEDSSMMMTLEKEQWSMLAPY